MENQLEKGLQEELQAIGKYQPVFAGDVISKQRCKELIEMGLVLKYEGDYCLTEKGKYLFKELFPNEKLGGKLSNSYSKH